ncbi:MAG: hypothetical protein AMXMBFR53_08720 [Gemmatimonadota bacterium]
MKKPLKIALGTTVGLLVVAQFIPVDRSNPPVSAALVPPAGQVGDIMRAACNDCHTHETVWPWYSRVAPVSLLVADHVVEGREHLNFSTWGEQTAKRRDHKLEEFIEMVEDGAMPLRSYTLAHPEARLSDSDRQLLIEWARAERARIQSTPGFGGADNAG